jgi:ABC-type uncharacterized transport system ATPase subunit
MEDKKFTSESEIVKEILYIAELHGLSSRERLIKIADLLNEHFPR